ncbi:MAG: hypothetical protein ACYSTF_02325 [Planctomycetota bacterium]|jgi:hypothetical protein
MKHTFLSLLNEPLQTVSYAVPKKKDKNASLQVIYYGVNYRLSSVFCYTVRLLHLEAMWQRGLLGLAKCGFTAVRAKQDREVKKCYDKIQF